ncbi:SLC13 family permease [Luminiphilus sp.]|nr:SLC13 family permease [Luminiphilus sp.]MDA8660238.1 SLC13 family permease [Luminiphilus sp.]MDA9848186.1 SLC13 family permease [Luminiphilus sp.]
MVVTSVTASLCIFWWIFEPIPIPVTSLLPLALMPMFGVLTPAQTGAAYGSPLILLLMGGFLLSRGMESTGAHKRVALGVIRLVGSESPRRLVLGFMISGAALSMWISNTATVLMLLPVALAVLDSAEQKERLAAPLLLGLAWSCSIGGMGTPIGTPPNLIFMQVYEDATGQAIGFTQWMSWGVPVVVTMIAVTALWLTRSLPNKLLVTLPETTAWRSAEKRVLVVFGLTGLAWMTRSEPLGGWRELLGIPGANDASVAFLAVIVLFVLRDNEGTPLITWQEAARIPWGVLLLFAGGICLASAFVASGLSAVAGEALVVLTTLPTYLMLLLICLAVTFMTEATSNTATTALLMPILAAAAIAAGVEPALLMVPAAMSASCAFMLPVATAPNAVIYGTDRVGISTMFREGLLLNLVGAFVVSLGLWWLLPN